MSEFEENEVKESGCVLGGCLGKVLGFILMVILMMCAKTCGRTMMRSTYKNNTSSVNVNMSKSEKAELTAQLYKVMGELRANLPQQIDPVTIQKDVQMDKYYFYYICDLDDSQMEFANADMSILKNTQAEGLKQILPNMKVLVKSLIETDRGLVYRYHGTASGITRDIAFSKNELTNMLSKI